MVWKNYILNLSVKFGALKRLWIYFILYAYYLPEYQNRIKNVFYSEETALQSFQSKFYNFFISIFCAL